MRSVNGQEQEETLYIRETFVNETAGHQLGECDWYETGSDTLGDLFRSLKREYGNGQNMYVGDGRKIGWVFTGRATYEDSGEPYSRSVWVEVSTTEPSHVHTIENVTHPWAVV